MTTSANTSDYHIYNKKGEPVGCVEHLSQQSNLLEAIKKLRDEYQTECNRLDDLLNRDDLGCEGAGNRAACHKIMKQLTQIINKAEK